MEEHGHVTVAVHSKTVNDKRVFKLKQIRVTTCSMNVSMCYTRVALEARSNSKLPSSLESVDVAKSFLKN
jgi:hypothetical protein